MYHMIDFFNFFFPIDTLINQDSHSNHNEKHCVLKLGMHEDKLDMELLMLLITFFIISLDRIDSFKTFKKITCLMT